MSITTRLIQIASRGFGSLTAEAAIQSDAGYVRSINQDAGSFCDAGKSDLCGSVGALMVLADGMGGHRGGEVASEIATRIIPHEFTERPGRTRPALRAAFQAANLEIFRLSQAKDELHGMGTTAVALGLRHACSYVAHVGDSRAYRLRNGHLLPLTRDHSVVQELVRRRLLSPKDAETHPDRHVILRALGVTTELEIEIRRIGWIRPGDRFLLTTDGLHELIREAEMTQILAACRVHEVPSRLIDLANARGADDNVTAGVLEVGVGPGRDRPVRRTRDGEKLR